MKAPLFTLLPLLACISCEPVGIVERPPTPLDSGEISLMSELLIDSPICASRADSTAFASVKWLKLSIQTDSGTWETNPADATSDLRLPLPQQIPSKYLGERLLNYIYPCCLDFKCMNNIVSDNNAKVALLIKTDRIIALDTTDTPVGKFFFRSIDKQTSVRFTYVSLASYANGLLTNQCGIGYEFRHLAFKRGWNEWYMYGRLPNDTLYYTYDIPENTIKTDMRWYFEAN